MTEPDIVRGPLSRFERGAGYYVVPFAGVAFMWFMAAIRERGSIRSDRFFDTIFLISGAVFVAMLYAGVGATASLLAAPQICEAFEPTEETIRTGASSASLSSTSSRRARQASSRW